MPENQYKADLESALDRNRSKLEKDRKVSLAVLVILFVLGCGWIYFTFVKVTALNKEVETNNNNIARLKKEIISLDTVKGVKKHTVDSLENEIKLAQRRVDSIHLLKVIDNGFNPRLISGNRNAVKNSFLADSLYSVLLKNNRIDTSLAIQYFSKTLDQQKVWSSMKILGYKDISYKATVNTHLQSKKTNALYLFNNVKLYDVKILALMLIRAGNTINTIQWKAPGASSVKYNLVQIGSKAFADDQDHFKDPPLTVQQIQKATKIEDLLLNQ